MSGVASLSSRFGDFGVSPAEESSIAVAVFRGVEKSALKAGTGGRALLGDGGWAWLGLEGDPYELGGPATILVSMSSDARAAAGVLLKADLSGDAPGKR